MRARLFLFAAGLVPVLLNGCAQAPRPVRLTQAPPPPAAPPPERPADLPARLTPPPLGADGRYATINRNVSPAGALWHVRSALNVAALGCRGPEDARMIAAYNMLLKRHAAPLSAADKALQAEFRARSAGDWRAEHDRYLTRLYNFFAQPIGVSRFCAEALAAAAEAETLPAASLASWAPATLARLEAPFTDGYARYDDWQRRLAAWQAGREVRLAQATAPAPAPSRAKAPRLAYAPLETIIDWAPAGPLRTASLR